MKGLFVVCALLSAGHALNTTASGLSRSASGPSRSAGLPTNSSATATATATKVPGDSFVHPIVISGKHFYDSITSERFFIKGVDYQPGGSAAYTKSSDPLSDIDQCARDIYLMQQLGVNTVRIYTVNPDLDHDDCMTMLAAANMYLLLDVNSPLYSESLNRYEPWTTYTPQYLKHIFAVVDQFSRYNNTLGFFIGNEIVNDERSAAVSPPYIRAVSRDVKDYMHYNCPRVVPIGYSAADDLKYRTQLPDYLACGDPETTIDFYGVNSYQWCGNQTMQTSGYDVLVEDHQEFGFPVFFSEFGCNHIQPRIFQEIEALYSSEMAPTFEGGLVYEYSQEVNDYGLVKIAENGDAYVRGEFETLKQQFSNANSSIAQFKTNSTSLEPGSEDPPVKLRPQQRETVACKTSYSYLSGADKPVPDSFGTDMIRNGVRAWRGKYNSQLLTKVPVTKFKVYNVKGKAIANPQITVVNNFTLHADEQGWFSRDAGTEGRKSSNLNESGNRNGNAKARSSGKKKQKDEHKKSAKNGQCASHRRPPMRHFYIVLLFILHILN